MPRGSAVGNIQVIGIEPRSALKVRHYPLAEGAMLSSGDRGVTAVGSSLARALDLQVGDFIELPTARGLRRLRVIGILDTVAAAGTEEAYVTLPTRSRCSTKANA